MRIHKREKIVTKATTLLREACLGVELDHLTDGEFVNVITTVFNERLQSWSKYKIREERHGDMGKPGGLE